MLLLPLGSMPPKNMWSLDTRNTTSSCVTAGEKRNRGGWLLRSASRPCPQSPSHRDDTLVQATSMAGFLSVFAASPPQPKMASLASVNSLVHLVHFSLFLQNTRARVLYNNNNNKKVYFTVLRVQERGVSSGKGSLSLPDHGRLHCVTITWETVSQEEVGGGGDQSFSFIKNHLS